ncbi:MAG TPA: translation initiation factor IF-2, partial [Verrucomicrobiota bacterium]|nr:translation initiation factor IF-2 [Verrucomicrobiota bacterium]
EQMGYTPAPPAAPAPPPPPPVEIVSPPTPEPPPPPPDAEPAAAPPPTASEPQPGTVTIEAVPQSEPAPATVPHPEAPAAPAPAPLQPAAHQAPEEIPAPEPEPIPAAPQDPTPTPVPQEPAVAAMESTPPVDSPVVAAQSAIVTPTTTPAPPPPPVPPAAPPPPTPPEPLVPPPPKVGDKVGFIVLPPPRPRPGERLAQKPPPRPVPGKPEPPRGRADGRVAPPMARAPGMAPRASATPATSAREPGRPAPLTTAVPTGGEITLKPPIIVRDLAEHLHKKPFQLIADLMEMGVFATVNQAIEPEIAKRVCAKYNYSFRLERRGAKPPAPVHAGRARDEEHDEDPPASLKPRAPVVTIMGHVDHGKTTLLDVIRKSNVAAGEAGGITQHIGAYTIAVPRPDDPKALARITFLDTPGHAAFSSMRARGANVTDLVILVVAANDGVMPQTIEALNHAQAAHVPIIVAVNKSDHPNANPLRVRQQLQEKGLTPDEWGGETIFVDVSALTRQGVDKLLEMLLLQAEILELKANPDRSAKGNVIESGLEPGGPTATVLVRKGTLRVGDIVLCGHYYGRVRALISESNKRLKDAGPSDAVKLLGLNGVPEAGAEFLVVENERSAREDCEQRSQAARLHETAERRPKVTLETLFDTLAEEQAKILRVVVKGDTQGSVEAIVEALKKLESTKVALEIIHSAVGTVTESDVLLASASKAIILGFHTRIDSTVPDLARREGVQIKLYAIIYELIDQVKEAMAGLLDPLLEEVVFGSAEVRRIFALSKGGNVAGCTVTNGRIVKGKARVMRHRNLIFEGIIHTLRRFQDEVNEVRAGMECGIRLDGFDDFQEGDLIECYRIDRVPQKL